MSNSGIFAYFIKHCFVDFVNVDFNEIVSACEKNYPIAGVEDNLISGAKIIYDVFAYLSLPNNEGKTISALFNGEHQNKANPGYYIYQRANYYNSRIEASEKGIIFEKSHFKELQKVYAFWIMMDHARYLDGVMNRVHNEEESLGKEYHFPKDSYDDRETVLLYPKREYDYEGDLGNDFEHALAFANLLFSDDIPVSEKKYYLKKRFKIPIDDELEKGLDSMCNLGFSAILY